MQEANTVVRLCMDLRADSRASNDRRVSIQTGYGPGGLWSVIETCTGNTETDAERHERGEQ